MTGAALNLTRGALLLCLVSTSMTARAADLVGTIARVKPSIVGIGSYMAVRRPPARLYGTGFVIGEGNLAATNFHVIDQDLDAGKKEEIVIFVGVGRKVEYRKAEILARDERHDLALLRFGGHPLPALDLGSGPTAPEGTAIAFTGFPIGAVLGLHPVTHQGIVSALTPIVIPAHNARELTVDKIATLRDPFEVLQLDATAYPGNSGSPVYRVADGTVVGIINQVFVKGKKEDVLRDPSAITYAIPVRYLRALLDGT